MILRDLHTHTNYCDGNNTAEEMVLAAIEKGMECIGFSGHVYAPACERYCMSMDGTEKYIKEITALKEKYKEKIEILCGIEYDYYSEYPIERFDYAIGSVHYIEKNGEFVEIDHSREILDSAADRLFGGDFYALAECYFETVGDVLRKTNADIIGHFDLISKFNEDGVHFDVNNPRYVAAWKKAVDRLVPYGKPFEINTGAITRGYRKTPYPNPDMINYIKEKGGKLILSSDSHSITSLCFGFEEYEKLL